MLLADRQQQLADMALLRADGFGEEEIWTGCSKKTPGGGLPEALIAEATASLGEPAASPIDSFRSCLEAGGTIAPVSVIIDPLRAGQVFGTEPGTAYSPALSAVYRRHLAQAELVVVNKCDLLAADGLAKLRGAIEEELPGCIVCTVSLRTGEGLDEWFQCLMGREHKPRAAQPPVNSQGEGASLASLNCVVKLSSVKYWDSGRLLMEIATGIQNLLRAEAVELAHLKMVLSPTDDLGEVTALNLVRAESSPVVSREISEPIQAGELILSLKAEADPETLHSSMNRALLTVVERHTHLFVRMEHCEHFRLSQ